MALANFSLWDAGRSGRSERSGRSGRAVAENYPDTAYLRHRQVRAATRNDVVPLLPHGQSANSPYRARDKALSFSLSLSPPFAIDDLFLRNRSGTLIAKTLNRLFADISVFSISFVRRGHGGLWPVVALLPLGTIN